MADLQARIRSWLYPWQWQWLQDNARWKVGLKSRQIGFTEVCSLEPLLHAMRHPGHTCYLVSTKVANARRQLLDRIKNRWLPLMRADKDLAVKVDGVEVYKNEIHLPNGSKIIATAHDPERLRGNDRSSYWMDEFAFWRKRIHEGLVDAVWPQIDAVQNDHGVLRLFSTPWTKEDNLFYEVWSNLQGRHDHFSRHKWDIHDAVAAAPEQFPFDIEGKRQKYPMDKWEREYLCVFLELGDRYFTRSELLERDEPWDGWRNWPVYMGVDLGKMNDFTSVVLLRKDPSNDRLVAGPAYMMRSVNYKRQRQVITALIEQHNPEMVNVDITAHQSFVDEMDAPATVKGLMGNRERKVDNTMDIKERVEHDRLRFDFDDTKLYDDGDFRQVRSQFLLDDLCKVQQTSTPSGKQKFDVPRDDTGHGDSYSALLLALEGAVNRGIGLFIPD